MGRIRAAVIVAGVCVFLSLLAIGKAILQNSTGWAVYGVIVLGLNSHWLLNATVELNKAKERLNDQP